MKTRKINEIICIFLRYSFFFLNTFTLLSKKKKKYVYLYVYKYNKNKQIENRRNCLITNIINYEKYYEMKT